MLKKVIKRIPGSRKLAQLLGMLSERADGRKQILDLLGKDSIGAEIGVHLGDFSQRILEIVHPVELHLIDPWEHQDSPEYKSALFGGEAEGGQREMDERHSGVCQRFADHITAGKVKVHRGYSTDVLERFPAEYFDWIYIDGNHLYEYVKKDLELSFSKTKPGGVVAGDDYVGGGWWKGGVKKAVDEFSRNQIGELILACNDQFAFRKPG